MYVSIIFNSFHFFFFFGYSFIHSFFSLLSRSPSKLKPNFLVVVFVNICMKGRLKLKIDVLNGPTPTTAKAIGSRFLWPNMKTDIKTWCKECLARKPITTPIFRPVPKFRFRSLHVDLVGPLKEWIMNHDHWSRWSLARGGGYSSAHEEVSFTKFCTTFDVECLETKQRRFKVQKTYLKYFLLSFQGLSQPSCT